MATSSERHNELMQKFIRSTLREIIEGANGYAEMMVMLESIIYGVMLATISVYGEKPRVAAGLAEAALQAAIEKLAEHENAATQK